MLGVFLLLLCLCRLSVQTFDPGCSFSNGQCIYNVKLGHESQCDAAGKRATSDGSSTSSPGFQACSCKDVESLNSNMQSLWSTMNTLQQNFNSLAGQLNVTQQKLGMKESEVAALLADNHNISAQLANHQLLMNKSQVELANTVASLNKELERVRKELRNTNDQLTTCKISLNGVDGQKSTSPVLYGNFVTHYCGFEDGHYCNYTLATCKQSDQECWQIGTGRQDVYSGPKEDHTFGAPNGHYMFIDPSQKPAYSSSSSSSSHPYRYARIISPTLPSAHQYCVRFWYTMFGTDIGRLRVYAQVGGGDGYPVYEKTGAEDQYWHMAQISLDSEYTAQPFKIVIEGNTNSYYSYSYNSHHNNHFMQGYTAFDDVYIYNTSCSDVPNCPAGSRKTTIDNVTSCYTFHVTPRTWSEAVKICKAEAPNAHLVSVNSQKEQNFLLDTIQSDSVYTSMGTSGWYTSGTDERDEGKFVWTDTGYPYPVNYTNWHIGQPNNVGNVQNCLLLQYSDVKYEWGDVNCQDKHPFICEMHV
ncbi:MAM and LDL-receptor class A domain-containing protein 2-like [Mercenaria mercenaria]|uniref:MAM and LDL-receptor class A domain-containing protein 2-like n=1 Tax=Mercenaria mercenaria TaxID=6596 RepID=UPI00234EC324|nr:MAM and LDL-receptor class A domain-containing protein 2-like [Mercenaria mercenaria]